MPYYPLFSTKRSRESYDGDSESVQGRSMSFPTVALSEIAHPVTRPVSVIAGMAYRTIGVKWWGEGAYERDTIDGSQTAAKTLSHEKSSNICGK